MIRSYCFLLLLSAATQLAAQPLYKWVEADGSLTFSTDKPPAGVKYDVVTTDSKTSITKASQGPSSVTKQNKTTQIRPSASVDTIAPAVRIRASDPAVVRTQQPRSNSSAATAAGKNINRSALSDGAGTAGLTTGTNSGLATPVFSDTTGTQGNTATRYGSVANNARSQKLRKCQDLKKRVFTLEQRLRTRLTPEDMDNTVVHIASYQNSYDRICAQ